MKVLHTHCESGRHLFTPETTYYYVEKSGKQGRHCLVCRREKAREYNRKRRFFNRLKNLTARNPNILRNPAVFKASELKKIDIGACYRAEIRASQTSNVLSETNTALLNNDQASIRRMSA